MTRLFKYYDEWKTTTLRCEQCQWTGVIDAAHVEWYAELFDCSCPVCDKMLAIVSYPTFEEIERAAHAGNAEAQHELSRIKASRESHQT